MRKKNQPLVSVIMPVYNAGDFLVEAIESILNQTYKKFEFIIVDDASTDNSWKILRVFAKKDKRIKIFRLNKNLGVSIAVKYAISKTKGKYLARMDADDIALTNRLEKQLNYLLTHKNTVAVGGQCQLIDKNGKKIGKKIFPTTHEKIYEYIFKFIPVQQPTLMIARERLPKDFEFYQEGLNIAEEVELLFKLFRYGKVENITDYVLKYRLHDNNSSLLDIKKTYFFTLYSRIMAIFKYGYRPSLSGFILTLAQSILVLFLPSKWILFLYKKMRRIEQDKILLKKKIQPTIRFAFRLF